MVTRGSMGQAAWLQPFPASSVMRPPTPWGGAMEGLGGRGTAGGGTVSRGPADTYALYMPHDVRHRAVWPETGPSPRPHLG